jgi:uncharacterized protein
MRVLLDTNILVSALIVPAGNPAAIYNAWEQDEIHAPDLRGAPRRVARRAAKAESRQSEQALQGAGRLVNQIKKLAEDIVELPRVKRSVDPDDNFLLALAEAGNEGSQASRQGTSSSV